MITIYSSDIDANNAHLASKQKLPQEITVKSNYYEVIYLGENWHAVACYLLFFVVARKLKFTTKHYLEVAKVTT